MGILKRFLRFPLLNTSKLIHFGHFKKDPTKLQFLASSLDLFNGLCMGPSSNIMEEFDENKYLGTLCSHNHEFKNTGQSLRYKSGKSCIICMKNNSDNYTEKNPEKVKEQHHEHYLNNIEYHVNFDREYRKNHKEEDVLYHKKYNETYYIKHREEKIKNVEKWNSENIDRIKRKQKERRDNNIGVRLNDCITTGIYQSLKGNKNGRHWEDLVGYTLQDLKQHLESQFKPWMNWGNYSNKKGDFWTIDHIKPIDSFNIVDYECEDFKLCWALSNLRPLRHQENSSKRNKIINI